MLHCIVGGTGFEWIDEFPARKFSHLRKLSKSLPRERDRGGRRDVMTRLLMMIWVQGRAI